MSAHITIPNSIITPEDISSAGMLELTWEKTYPQSAYEIQYKRVKDTAWSTFGKVSSTNPTGTLNTNKLTDMLEYHVRVVVYAESTTSGTNIYTGTDTTAPVSLIVRKYDKLGTIKVMTGSRIVDIPMLANTDNPNTVSISGEQNGSIITGSAITVNSDEATATEVVLNTGNAVQSFATDDATRIQFTSASDTSHTYMREDVRQTNYVYYVSYGYSPYYMGTYLSSATYGYSSYRAGTALSSYSYNYGISGYGYYTYNYTYVSGSYNTYFTYYIRYTYKTGSTPKYTITYTKVTYYYRTSGSTFYNTKANYNAMVSGYNLSGVKYYYYKPFYYRVTYTYTYYNVNTTYTATPTISGYTNTYDTGYIRDTGSTPNTSYGRQYVYIKYTNYYRYSYGNYYTTYGYYRYYTPVYSSYYGYYRYSYGENSYAYYQYTSVLHYA